MPETHETLLAASAADGPPATLVLPVRVDLTAVRGLAADLRARSDAALVIDASRVEVLGGLGLQLLLAACQTWSRAGRRLTFGPRSADFDRALAQFGVVVSQLECGAQA